MDSCSTLLDDNEPQPLSATELSFVWSALQDLRDDDCMNGETFRFIRNLKEHITTMEYKITDLTLNLDLFRMAAETAL